MWKLIFKNKQVEICCQFLSLESELSNEHKIEGLVRKAASTTGALQLQERQNIQKEQSLLQQKVEKLRTKTKKVVAEEKLQFQSVNSPSLSLPGEVPTSPPQETKQSDKVNDSQTLPITETNLSPLNLEAPEWQGSKWVPVSAQETNIKDTYKWDCFLHYNPFQCFIFLQDILSDFARHLPSLSVFLSFIRSKGTAQRTYFSGKTCPQFDGSGWKCD